MKQNIGNDTKAKREQYSINIRRSENEKLFNASRKRFIRDDHDTALVEEQIATKEDRPHFTNEAAMVLCVRSKEVLLGAMQSSNLEMVLAQVHQLREVLSLQSDPDLLPIEEFFESGIVEVLVSVLRTAVKSREPILLQETLWLISNLSAGTADRIEYLISLGTFRTYYDILECDSAMLFEHVSWSLANIVGEKAAFREQITAAGLWPLIFKNFDQFRSLASVQKTCSWLFANCLRCPPQIPPELVS